MNYIIGIDEAGRGPWAGPIVVGGFLVREDAISTTMEKLLGLNDSKKISHHKREALFSNIEYMQSIGECQYSFAYRDAGIIDQIGIREANRQSMQDVILSLMASISDDDKVSICIDGCDNYHFESIDAGYHFAKKKRKRVKFLIKQLNLSSETIKEDKKRIVVSYSIGGDGNISVISAASIVAKVLRDRMMCDFSVEFPGYGFDLHKGYGTLLHRKNLIQFGVTPIHRLSYQPVKKLIFEEASI